MVPVLLLHYVTDTFGRPESGCRFHPKGRWRNLAGDIVYDFSTDTQTIYMKERPNFNTSNNTNTVRAFRCIRLEGELGEWDERHTVALTFMTQGW